MLDVTQFRELIIKPALDDLLLYSKDAEELLLFTCAVESDGGTYLQQKKGPALGIYQMEPETYNDLWHNYLYKKSNLLVCLVTNFNISMMPSEDRLIYDLRYATAMCRIHYARVQQDLPSSDNLSHIWDYYKKYYNSPRGAAEKNESIRKYLSFVKS